MQNDKCVGISNTIKLIGSKWSMLLLYNLFGGKKRFGELQRALVGVSPKTLSERLKQLEKEGIINKKIYAQVPLKVEYSLTNKGLSLSKVFKTMDDWGSETQVVN